MHRECKCCGTCCRSGGPPLHSQDIDLVRSGILVYDDLVTVRRGEMVCPPLTETPVPAETEWIKLQGMSGGWCCRFLDTVANRCNIYANRPLSCRTLKCWDTEEIVAMAGLDLLCRTDLIGEDDPILPLVLLHEQQCPVPDLQKVAETLLTRIELNWNIKQLNILVQEDMEIRSEVVRKFMLPVSRELFYFGRPLFHLLHPLGLIAAETPSGIELHLKPH